MMDELDTSQHNMCSCSVTSYGDLLFVNTSNGLDESHINLPAPDAPSFICMDKNTGEVYWTDSSPGNNILHGQWSSPAVGELGGVPQVLFAGGDGILYSFRADKGSRWQSRNALEVRLQSQDLQVGPGWRRHTQQPDRHAGHL